jgi:polysaccharide export outer membrane protein
MKVLKVLLTLLIVPSLVGPAPAALAQEKSVPQPASPPRPTVQNPTAAEPVDQLPEDYQIGAGDVLDILVDDAPELSRNYRVDSGGEFTMRYVGRVKAKGKSLDELASMIANSLRGDYLADPNVTVAVKQRNLNIHSFYVQGAVTRPGAIQTEGHPDLLKILSLAGGLADNHGTTAFVIRTIKPDDAQPASPAAASSTASPIDQQRPDAPRLIEEKPKYTFYTVNINGMFKGLSEQNMYLEPGDIVNIPRFDLFFVAGDVRAPGSFQLRDGTTLRQAIALAQGLKATASASKGIIFRENPENGQRMEIKVDIGKVMSGKKADEIIRPNDVVVVPYSATKAITYQVLNSAVLGLMMGLISTAIY